MLKTTKLNKYYHRFGRKPLHVINNTSIEIPQTGIIAVIGASGAGKTTLINTISGLDSFKSGSIEFENVKMNHYSNRIADKLRMKNYGFIFQNYYLLEKQTVYENVKISLDAFDISESEKKKRINYVLNQLGIAKYTNKSVSNLSGGEQQRVSIARALVKAPRVIFADEPTGSLDEITTFNVLNILKQVSKTCAVFIVTHERDIISYYADYIIELDNGVVVKEFVPTEKDNKTLAVDQNIYLKELDNVASFDKENFDIKVYSDGSSIDKNEVKIAVKNGKVYLEASNDIKILSEKSENHLIDGERKQIKDYVKEDFDYKLDHIPYSNNKIGLIEILKKGYQNFKIKRPIKNILKVVCASLSVILLVLMEGLSTIKNTDISNYLETSKGNIYLNVLPTGEDMGSLKMSEAYQTLYDDISSSNVKGEVFFENRDKLVFFYDGFFQVKSKDFFVPYHDFKDIDTFKKKSLVYGNMPSDGFDVVVDEYILERLVSETILKNIITDYGYFVGKTFTSSTYDYSFTVSGICRTQSPTIYGYHGLNLARTNVETHAKIADIDFAKKIYPEISDLVIEPGYYYKNEEYPYTKLNDLVFNGNFTRTVPFDYLINKADYDKIKSSFAAARNDMYVQTDGKASSINALTSVVKNTVARLKEKQIYVSVEIDNRYQDQANLAFADLNNILSSVEIIALVIASLALILVILSTYLSMLNQISDIAVYRSLGYSKWFLGAAYLIELGLIAFIYSFIGGGLTYLTMFILDIIPIVPYHISMSIWMALLGVVALPILIMIIGIIPIALVFRLTPANIYNRYNRRINNE